MDNSLDHSIYWVWITTIKGLKKSKIKQLIHCFKSPKEIWELNRREIKRQLNFSEEELNILEKSKSINKIQKWLSNLERNHISYYSIEDREYPSILKNISNPPMGIYVKGKLPCFENGFLAMVGSRKCTEYGIRVARKIGQDLVKMGFGIISGLAQGIDTQAHKITLELEGHTVAVIANGLDICYPSNNMNLMKSIEEKGAIISEYPPGTKPIPWFFPARNRIISGLSQGVIIIEAGEKSGALITADMALEQGKEVFAIPGNIFSLTSIGTNKLIQQGAKLVSNTDDILEELNINVHNNYNNKKNIQYKDESISRLAIDENLVYDCISFEPSQIDILSVKTNYDINKLQGLLTLLELKGLIKQLPGKRFIRI